MRWYDDYVAPVYKPVQQYIAPAIVGYATGGLLAGGVGGLGGAATAGGVSAGTTGAAAGVAGSMVGGGEAPSIGLPSGQEQPLLAPPTQADVPSVVPDLEAQQKLLQDRLVAGGRQGTLAAGESPLKFYGHKQLLGS